MTDTGAPHRSTEEDAALARRFRDGDVEALGELYLRHFPSVYQTVGPRAADPDAAQDLAQDAFVRAWEQRRRLRDPTRFRPWLLATARNLALDNRRHRLRHPTEEASEDLLGVGPGTEAVALAGEAPQLVWNAVSGLEPRHREVLTLAVREQLTTPEVGTALGVSSAHAAVMVHRAKRALEASVRSLLVATRARDCPGLKRLVGPGVAALSAAQRASVERHMRRCEDCRAAADRLTQPSELFGLWPVLALPSGWSTAGMHAVLGHAGAAGAGLTAGAALSQPPWYASHPIAAAGSVACVAAVAVALASHEHATAPPPRHVTVATAPAVLAGRIFVSGDDPDVHAHYGPNTAGPRHAIQAAIRLVTRGRSNPRLLLVTDLRDPGGPLQGDPRLGLRDAGYTTDVADHGSGTPGVLDLHTVSFAGYDAVIVASDFGGWLRQDELDILDARRADLAAYTAAGGGVIAFAEGGASATVGAAPLTTHGYFGFLPASWTVVPVSEYQDRATVTAAGIAVGLLAGDETGNYLHAAFAAPAGATVLVTDTAGRAVDFWLAAPAPTPAG